MTGKWKLAAKLTHSKSQAACFLIREVTLGTCSMQNLPIHPTQAINAVRRLKANNTANRRDRAVGGCLDRSAEDDGDEVSYSVW